MRRLLTDAALAGLGVLVSTLVAELSNGATLTAAATSASTAVLLVIGRALNRADPAYGLR